MKCFVSIYDVRNGLMPIAAAVEIGEGKIVTYGSSRAINDEYYGKYITTNWPFIKGVLLWLAGEIWLFPLILFLYYISTFIEAKRFYT